MNCTSFNRSHARCLAGIAPLLVGVVASAAPLTWFPGASLSKPRSSAATVVSPYGPILMFGGSPVDTIDVLSYGKGTAQQIPSPRFAPGAVALANGQYFVFGGKQTNSATSITSSVLSYNPVSSGTDDPNVFGVSPMHTRRYDMGCASDSANYAYAIGGLGNNSAALASVERYDPVADAWTDKASLPAGQYHFGAAYDGTNFIYTFGGRTNVSAGAETATVLSYDVGADLWRNLSPMPIPTAGSAAIRGADGKFYVVGGTAGGVVTNLVQVYDPVSDSWQLATPLPAAVTSAGGVTDALGRLVVLGGADANGVDQTATWISQQLNLADAAPIFTGPLPPSKANCTIPYAYTNHASGNPQPVFFLLTAPDGMQIDPYGGGITWTPQTNQFGTNLVVIVASNYSGIATQSVAINTLGPPLPAPTNLVIASTTDTSVTLSWDAITFLIGPGQYLMYERTFVHDPRGSGGSYHYRLVATSAIASATIGGLSPGSSHTYVVSAFAAGVESPYNAALGVVLPQPAAPPNFRLTGLTSTTTSLAWDPSPGPVPIAYYSVFEIVSYSLVPVAGATGLTSTAVTVMGITPGTTHSYVVRAFDTNGYGSPYSSQQVTVFNPVPAPASVSSPALLAGGSFQFSVDTDYAQTTLVQATSDPTDPASWATIATNPPTGSTFNFTDPDAASYPSRFYRVVNQ